MTGHAVHGEGSFNCADAARLVCEERDRALLAAEQEALGDHLETCPYCQAARRQFAAVFGDLDELLGKDHPS
jgi:hypothetical protein